MTFSAVEHLVMLPIYLLIYNHTTYIQQKMFFSNYPLLCIYPGGFDLTTHELHSPQVHKYLVMYTYL
jgi:hypothetical protein